MMEMNALSCVDDFLGPFLAAFLYLLSFYSSPSHSLFFPYSSLASHHSLPCPLLALLPSLFSCVYPCSDALTWPKTGKTLQGTFPAESQDGFQGRLKVLFVLHNRKNWVCTSKHGSLFIMSLLSWCLTKPIWILILSGSLTGIFQVLEWSLGLSELLPFSIASYQRGGVFFL